MFQQGVLGLYKGMTKRHALRMFVEGIVSDHKPYGRKVENEEKSK